MKMLQRTGDKGEPLALPFLTYLTVVILTKLDVGFHNADRHHIHNVSNIIVSPILEIFIGVQKISSSF
jgi:hypothetical protein